VSLMPLDYTICTVTSGNGAPILGTPTTKALLPMVAFGILGETTARDYYEAVLGTVFQSSAVPHSATGIEQIMVVAVSVFASPVPFFKRKEKAEGARRNRAGAEAVWRGSQN
jgi:hypothetical protein